MKTKRQTQTADVSYCRAIAISNSNIAATQLINKHIEANNILAEEAEEQKRCIKEPRGYKQQPIIHGVTVQQVRMKQNCTCITDIHYEKTKCNFYLNTLRTGDADLRF